MTTWIRYEGAAYWLLFTLTFLVIAVWESFRPRTALQWAPERRWRNHGLLLAIAIAAQTIVLRMSPVILAGLVSGSRFGILNRSWLPFSIRCVVAFVVLDLIHYLTHRAFHSVGFLWRIHEVHHSDPDYDVSTAGRFHPVEAILTQGVYVLLVALIAPPAIAVFAAELSTMILNLFAHANVALPDRLERALRRVIITPGLHRIHHSEEIEEQSRNFGQTFSWWDYAFGTFLGSGGKTEVITGIAELRGSRSLELGFTLMEPLRPRSPAGPDPVPDRAQ